MEAIERTAVLTTVTTSPASSVVEDVSVVDSTEMSEETTTSVLTVISCDTSVVSRVDVWEEVVTLTLVESSSTISTVELWEVTSETTVESRVVVSCVVSVSETVVAVVSVVVSSSDTMVVVEPGDVVTLSEVSGETTSVVVVSAWANDVEARIAVSRILEIEIIFFLMQYFCVRSWSLFICCLAVHEG